MNGPMTYFSEKSWSSLLQLTMQVFPMKEAKDFIFVGIEQLRGVPSTFVDHKNDFHVQGTFKHAFLL